MTRSCGSGDELDEADEVDDDEDRQPPEPGGDPLRLSELELLALRLVM